MAAGEMKRIPAFRRVADAIFLKNFIYFSSKTYRLIFAKYIMYKKIITLMFLLSFAGQTFSRMVIIIDYYVNTGSFAKNCENKAIPLMHCNGKCQMMKKIKEENKKDQEYPLRKLENRNEVISSKSSFCTLHNLTPAPAFNFELILISGSVVDRSYSIFHPPALV
jgi:hypothetical protein